MKTWAGIREPPPLMALPKEPQRSPAEAKLPFEYGWGPSRRRAPCDILWGDVIPQACCFGRLPVSMKLREALQIVHRPVRDQGPSYPVHLVTGFEPLHLSTFLAAHLRQRLEAQVGDRAIELRTGLFGDLGGNWRRALQEEANAPVVAVLEWSDLHPALGWREASFVSKWDEDTALADVAARLQGWLGILHSASRRRILSLPALPLPPWVERGLDGQYPAFSLELHAIVQQFARDAARAGVRVARPVIGVPWDPAKHMATGFPYTLEFADRLAGLLADLLIPAPPVKGLITDLDNTLWHGVVGDDGPEGVHWDLDHQARAHGWWQQFLAALSAQGILIAIASRNDPGPVGEALGRSDLLVPAASFYPVEVHWEDKASSIERIAKAWNIGLDGIVFVDDNPIELDMVRRALPSVECVQFPSGNAAAVAAMIERLRARFAKEEVREEDRLRHQPSPPGCDRKERRRTCRIVRGTACLAGRPLAPGSSEAAAIASARID